MRDKQDSTAALTHLAHLAQAFLLEGHIADGQDFIDYKNFRIKVGGHSKGEPDIHAAGIAFHGSVEKLFDLRKRHNLLELGNDLGFAHTQNRTIQEDVLATREFGVKAGSHFQQTGKAAAHLDEAFGRIGDTRNDLE